MTKPPRHFEEMDTPTKPLSRRELKHIIHAVTKQSIAAKGKKWPAFYSKVLRKLIALRQDAPDRG